MISWVVIIVLVVLGVAAIKMNHLRHRIFIIILITFALFFYGTIVLVNSQNDLNFDSTEGIFDASKVYVGWLANGFSNAKNIVGNAIKMDWSSTDGEFFDSSKKNK